MRENNLGICQGCVYSKLTESKYTYVYSCPVETWIMAVLGNRSIADAIASNVSVLVSLLSNPACQLIPQLVVDYNFIEVEPYGTCFDIENKRFVVDPPELEGSPRAYVKYSYTGEVPRPAYFIEG